MQFLEISWDLGILGFSKILGFFQRFFGIFDEVYEDFQSNLPLVWLKSVPRLTNQVIFHVNEITVLASPNFSHLAYRKPPTISPGLIYFRKRFLMDLYKGGGGLLYGWAYTWTIFCVSNKQVRNKQVSHKQGNKRVLSSDYWA